MIDKTPVESNDEAIEEKELSWKPSIIYSAIMVLLPLAIGFIVSVSVNDFRYIEILCALFGVLSLLFTMIRIRARDSKNIKKDKTILEDKKTISYRSWFRLQICMALVGVVLLILSLVFFFVFK